MSAGPVLGPHATSGGTEITLIPHAVSIIYAGLFLALLALLLWREHVAFVKRCTCQKRGTILRPKWKQHDPRDDYDRYDKEDE